MLWWQICLVALASGFFFLAIGLSLSAFGAAIFVICRFMSIASAVDIVLARQSMGLAGSQGAAGPVVAGERPNRTAPPDTEGDFVPYSEEAAFLNEEANKLRQQGLSEEELNDFLTNAVGADLGKE